MPCTDIHKPGSVMHSCRQPPPSPTYAFKSLGRTHTYSTVEAIHTHTQAAPIQPHASSVICCTSPHSPSSKLWHLSTTNHPERLTKDSVQQCKTRNSIIASWVLSSGVTLSLLMSLFSPSLASLLLSKLRQISTTINHQERLTRFKLTVQNKKLNYCIMCPWFGSDTASSLPLTAPP